jgi:hypothetical protein
VLIAFPEEPNRRPRPANSFASLVPFTPRTPPESPFLAPDAFDHAVAQFKRQQELR